MTTFKRHLATAAQQLEPRLQLAVEQGKRTQDLQSVRFARAAHNALWVDALRSAHCTEASDASHARLWRSRRDESQTSVPLRCDVVEAKRSH
jgi:hypothetical protein